MNVLDTFKLDGKVAVVTGGAGLYGRQIVETVAEAGAKTFAVDYNIEKQEEVAESFRKAGMDVTALQYDQGNEESILAMREQIVEQAGRIDVLINGAVLRTTTMGWEDDASTFDESMRVNATGLFMITRAIGKVMEKQQSGSIINIGSIMGMLGVENANYAGTDMHGWYPDYFFHKGGMINFTRFCGSYFGRSNVRVNCVSPGGFQVDSQPKEFVDNYSARTQLGRMASHTDLKGVIVFLASDASTYITGANIPVDGGYTAK